MAGRDEAAIETNVDLQAAIKKALEIGHQEGRWDLSSGDLNKTPTYDEVVLAARELMSSEGAALTAEAA